MIKNPTIKWISVDDALPHVHERVLVVCINLENKMQRHVSICDYWGCIRPGHLRWSGRKQVTHWAPLPELPSMNKENKQ